MAQTRRSTARGLEQVPSRRLSAVPAEEAASAAARRGKRRGRIKYRIFTLGLGLDMTMLFLLRVILLCSRRVHHDLRIADVLRAVTHVHRDAVAANARERVGFIDVAAGDDIILVV